MSRQKIRISGTGCALADYLYPEVSFASDGFVKFLSRRPGDGGLSPGKLVFTEELELFAGMAYPGILREITGGIPPASFNIGGPGVVSMIHATQMLDSEDYEVSFYGLAGKDDTAQKIFDLLRQTPLEISGYSQGSEKATPFTDVFSDPGFDKGHGERTFVNNIGAAWDFTPDKLGDGFFSAGIVCFGGTAIVPHIHDHLTELLTRAKESQCVTVVNTVYDFRNEKERPGERWPLGKGDSSGLIDVLLMDREEALRISGQSSTDSAALFFALSGVSSFVITNGAEPFWAFSDGRLFNPFPLTSLPVSEKVAGCTDRPGDTTGCGDNFAGGIIASLAMQLSDKGTGNPGFLEALSWGVASGGYACYYIGGTMIENHPGQKRALVEEVRHAWLQQVSRQIPCNE